MKKVARGVLLACLLSVPYLATPKILNELPSPSSLPIVTLHAPIAVVVPAPVVKHPPALFNQAPIITRWDSNGKNIPIYYLETHIKTSPSRDEFARSIGTRLKELTEQSGFENCSALCVANNNPNNWASVITTIKAQSTCLVIDVCPEGYKLANADIHSHIHTSLYKPNDIDKKMLKDHFTENDLVLTEPDSFSEEDFKRTGYMVSEKSLWFQTGKGNVRKIAEFDD